LKNAIDFMREPNKVFKEYVLGTTNKAADAEDNSASKAGSH